MWFKCKVCGNLSSTFLSESLVACKRCGTVFSEQILKKELFIPETSYGGTYVLSRKLKEGIEADSLRVTKSLRAKGIQGFSVDRKGALTQLTIKSKDFPLVRSILKSINIFITDSDTNGEKTILYID